MSSLHTILLSLEGGLLAFGLNNEGQLGLGHKKEQWQPVEVPWDGPQTVQVSLGWFHSLVLDAEGGVWEAGQSRSPPSSLIFQQALELPPIILISAGRSHSAAIDHEGGLWLWTSSPDPVLCTNSLPQRV